MSYHFTRVTQVRGSDVRRDFFSAPSIPAGMGSARRTWEKTARENPEVSVTVTIYHYPQWAFETEQSSAVIGSITGKHGDKPRWIKRKQS